MDQTSRQLWEEFLNPDVMRPKLLASALFIAGFEALKDAIIDGIHSFFCNGFDASGARMDPKYQTDVLSRNKSPTYASLEWLMSMGAIDSADIAAFDRVKACRNTLAHNLLSTLGSQGMPPDFDKCFVEMLALLRKIEVWWIKEVEIPTNPDFDGQEVADANIQPGRCIGMQILCDIALGEPEQSRATFEQFRALLDERSQRA